MIPTKIQGPAKARMELPPKGVTLPRSARSPTFRRKLLWGIYISNFVFLVGLAAAAVMIVMPAYVLHDVDFSKAVLIGGR